jgi:uncharacterized protein (TIGR03083 family)
MDHASAIVESSARIATLADQADLTMVIPSCPAWTAGDLVFHLASVHRFWAAAVREGNPEARPNVEEYDVDDADLVSWAREQTVSLVDALGSAQGLPCWTWWGEPRTADAVARHQALEAAVHCWDICDAFGLDFEIPFNQAVDGVAEFLEVMSPSMEMSSGNHLSFQPSDSAEAIRYGDPSREAITLSGLASDLLLAMYKRKPLEILRVDGDTSIVQRWLDAIDLS